MQRRNFITAGLAALFAPLVGRVARSGPVRIDTASFDELLEGLTVAEAYELGYDRRMIMEGVRRLNRDQIRSGSYIVSSRLAPGFIKYAESHRMERISAVPLTKPLCYIAIWRTYRSEYRYAISDSSLPPGKIAAGKLP